MRVIRDRRGQTRGGTDKLDRKPSFRPPAVPSMTFHLSSQTLQSHFLVDLHLHSHHSWATSRTCTIPEYWIEAQRKGLRVIGTGDITHPGWTESIDRMLTPAANGLLDLKPEWVRELGTRVPPACQAPVQFMLTGEINCVYRQGQRSRRVHHLVHVSTLDRARKLQHRLQPFGRLDGDGRPTLKLDSRDLLEMLLETDPDSALVPAHIWTPWYAMLGSRSGFDSIEECFRDLASEIRTVESGLSADPEMMMHVPSVAPRTIISSSDAHSPAKLGREATAVWGQPSYPQILRLLRSARDAGPAFTVEWPPAMGKYYWDGHRKCRHAQDPARQRGNRPICPVCHKPATRGVLARIQQLTPAAGPGPAPASRPPAFHTLPLSEVVALSLQRKAQTKAVRSVCDRLMANLGPEFHILRHAEWEEILLHSHGAVADAILAVRQGKGAIDPGYDGRYGTFNLPVPQSSD